jgi:hypothetical protein
MEELKWSGQDTYNAADLEEWVVDGKLAGEYKTAGILTVSATHSRQTWRDVDPVSMLPQQLARIAQRLVLASC